MATDTTTVNWNYDGKPNYAFGTGATRLEQLLGTRSTLLGLAIFAYLFVVQAFPWALWQYLLGALLAADTLGGAVANSLNSCKRFYHSPIQPVDAPITRILKQHMLFTVLHIHPILIYTLYPGAIWWYGFVWYAALLASTALVVQVPLYIQRPVAVFCIVLAVLAASSWVPAVPGFAWLLPTLFLKIVYGHAVQEEPYRPTS